MSARDLFEFFDRPSPLVARALVGCAFSIDGVGGMLVETEAYMRDDEASHSFRGPRSSNAAMFGPPATAYVYRVYGLHLCLNFVCRDAGAVLVRALVPEMGLQRMAERRGLANPRLLCSGPGRLGQALGIHLAMNGVSLLDAPFALKAADGPHAPVISGPRIGISRAQDRLWRFGLSGSPYLSKPFNPPCISLLDQEGPAP